MQNLDSRVNVSAEGNVKIVEFADRKILDEVNIMQIGRQLESLVEDADKPKLLLDFSTVEHMSSSALGVLITLHKHIREKSGQLRLCCIGPAIYEIFAITRLDSIFQIFESRQEAIKSFK